MVLTFNTAVLRLVTVQEISLHEKCPYSEFFWLVFSRIRTEYREIPRISSDLVRLRENTDQKTPNTDTFQAKYGRKKSWSSSKYFFKKNPLRMKEYYIMLSLPRIKPCRSKIFTGTRST